MTDPKSLAQYLLEGGLTRVCDELARFMLSFRDPDGFRLPELDERETNVHPIAGGQLSSSDTVHAAVTEFESRVEAWHTGDSAIPLHEFLGLTWEQYAQMLSGKPVEPLTTMPRYYGHGFASCGHGYAPGSPHCPQCHPTPENVTYLVNQHEVLRGDLREAVEERDALKARVEALESELRREHDLDGARAEDGRRTIERFANEFRAENGALRARRVVDQARIQHLESELTEARAALTSQHRELAAALGMVHEPSMGPTRPAEWPLLLARVQELTHSECERNERSGSPSPDEDHFLEAIGYAIDDALGWNSDQDREEGDYPARIIEAANELASLKDALTHEGLTAKELYAQWTGCLDLIAERDKELADEKAAHAETKTALAWERGWDLCRKAAMGAVVEAALAYLDTPPGKDADAMWALVDALSALDARQSEPGVTCGRSARQQR